MGYDALLGRDPGFYLRSIVRATTGRTKSVHIILDISIAKHAYLHDWVSNGDSVTGLPFQDCVRDSRTDTARSPCLTDQTPQGIADSTPPHHGQTALVLCKT